MTNQTLKAKRFCDINIEDPFFQSLKDDYPEFSTWFAKKTESTAYVFNKFGTEELDGFLYLKSESGPLEDTEPCLPAAERLKIGTFKINPHGTRLGERFLKRAFDTAIEKKALAIYVTVFEKHFGLVSLFKKYGFKKVAVKKSVQGVEAVFERSLAKESVLRDVALDYPRIPLRKNRHFVLALYPEWHSRLLPDSLLKTEDVSILEDVSHTNSIHKIYLAAMRGIELLKPGDTLLIYRTKDGHSAHYSSVITSLCVVEELIHINKFTSLKDFLEYCLPYSIFSIDELTGLHQSKKYPWIIRFTYNLALTKRVTRKSLIEDVEIPADIYWGFFQITTSKLKKILTISNDYEKARSLVYTS